MSKTRQTHIRSLCLKFSPGHTIAWHSHRWSQLIYASAGVLSVHSQQTCWVVPTHRALWIPAGLKHQIKMSGPVCLQTVYVPPQTARVRRLAVGAYEVPRLLRELIVHVCRLGAIDGASTESRTLVDFFLQQLGKLQPFPLAVPWPQDSRARRLADRVIESMDDRRSLTELANGSGASLRTLQRIFAAELGIPLAHWRNQVRMVRAIQLLEQNFAITRIATELGFESASSFIYAFRQHFGQTPGQFRTATANT